MTVANEPLVSAVIATYNAAKYVSLAIRSVLDQTYRNVEVLIVDDGSTDNTGEIILPLLADSRVRYLVQENKGQAAARNYGVRESRGDYIGFLDADDLWAPEKLALQMSLFSSARNIGVVYSRLVYIDEAGKQLRIAENELFRGRVSGPLLIRNFVGFGTGVVRRECFSRLGGFKEYLRRGDDYDLWLKFSTQYEFDYVDRPLLHYRIWSGQISNNCRSRYLVGIEIMKNFLQEFPGVVNKDTENEAWAHTYVGFGDCMLDVDQRRSTALRLYAQALRYRPAYLPAWKAIVKVVFRLRALASQ